MIKVKNPALTKKKKKSKDAIKRILDEYEFTPDFIPSSTQLFSKKSKTYCSKNLSSTKKL